MKFYGRDDEIAPFLILICGVCCLFFLFKLVRLVRSPGKYDSFWSVLFAACGFAIFGFSFCFRLIYWAVILAGLPTSHPNIALIIINSLSVIAAAFFVLSIACFVVSRLKTSSPTPENTVLDDNVWPPPPKDPDAV